MRLDWTLLKRGYSNNQLITHQGNANLNHSEIQLHTHHNT